MSNSPKPTASSATVIEPYKVRQFSYLGLWESSSTILKTYAIKLDQQDSSLSGLIDSAYIYTTQNLPALVEAEGHDHGLGYVILHAGEMSNWLLIHWWAYGDIALRHLASFDHGHSEFVSQDHRRFHACVWEHVVIDHERDAWVRHMSREDHSPQHYLNDRLADGKY